MISFTDDQILDLLKNDFNDTSISILSPIIRSRKGHYQELFYKLSKQGYLKVRVDGEIIEISPNLKLDRYKTHDIEVVIDRVCSFVFTLVIISLIIPFSSIRKVVLTIPIYSRSVKPYPNIVNSNNSKIYKKLILQ